MTASIHLARIKHGKLFSEAKHPTIDAMIDHGWYVAPDLYAAIVRKLESFE